MRACPSKGFLLDHNLNADEDYCDHCMGWIIPLLNKAGIEVAAHEHNHCGQCWAEMRVRGKPYQTFAGSEGDIRADPRWQSGYVDRWADDLKVAAADGVDPVKVISDYFAAARSITIVGSSDAGQELNVECTESDCIITTSSIYMRREVLARDAAAVVIEDAPAGGDLDAISERFNRTPASQRPLLLYGYLPPLKPSEGFPAFTTHNLPRPLPLLPLLIRAGSYQSDPSMPRPSAEEFALLIAKALTKRVRVIGTPVHGSREGSGHV